MPRGASAAAPERPALRVAFLWNGTLQADELLIEPKPVVVGSDSECLFPAPAGISEADALPVLEPSDAGYDLLLTAGLRGDVWLREQRRSVEELFRTERRIPLGPTDYGVVSIGSVSLFFQQVPSPPRAPRRALAIDSETVSSMGLAAFMAIALLLFLFMAAKEAPDPDPLELSADLIRTFMVTPPPENLIEEMKKESGTETKDPGKREREEGGKRHKGDSGRVGRERAPQEQTEIASPREAEVAAKVRQLGLLGALSGGAEGNAIAEALDVPDMGDVLGGLGSTDTILGRGSRGAGLLGTGSGGGGDGQGSLLGGGAIGTGAAAGKGSGLGRGKGGIGSRGKKKERVVSVTQGQPRVNGYLSPEQINRVVRANKAQIQYCYEVEVQKQPSLRGKLQVEWRINLQGSVTSARIQSSSLRNGRVEGCIVRQIRRWRFPKPDGGEVVVLYPFIFGVQG
ncbi:MAG: AgmX/PglI C-terminal domain-containing protein [Myxococcales bacterium]|nr:AgmX/PglI C-terminal domain-containing protein [Myxococcales bacterium]